MEQQPATLDQGSVAMVPTTGVSGGLANVVQFQNALAASAGAIVTSFLTTPLEVLKVRQQAASAQPAWSLVGAIVRQQGISALWTGLRATLMMNIPSQIVYMTLYERASGALRQQKSETLTTLAPLLAGGGARAVSSAAVSPVELLRTRMQAAAGTVEGTSLSLLASARHVVDHEGVHGLWRGLAPTLWRDVPFSCVYWLTYETLKQHLCAGTVFSTRDAFLAGASAGSVAALLTTPLDVIKTRQQLGSSAAAGGGMLGTLRAILRKEGAGGLFAGLGPRVVKVAPACAVMIAAYELGKSDRVTTWLEAASEYASLTVLRVAQPAARPPAASAMPERRLRRWQPMTCRPQAGAWCEGQSMSACCRL